MSIKTVADYLNNIITKYSLVQEKVNTAIEYLRFYGYLIESKEIKNYTLQEIIEGVSKFQSMFGITVDGEMGRETLRAMSYSRCAVKDNKVQEINGWSSKNLTYCIQNSVRQFDLETFATIIAKCFKNWSDVCDLHFERVSSSSKANMLIGVGEGRKYGFDGSMGVLAWAELSGANATGSRQMRFDLSENWLATDSMKNGIILEAVGSHEIGHLLNLTHSTLSGALMSPYYNSRVILPQPQDDILRIQAIYGPAVTPLPPDPDEPENPPDPPLPLPTETSIITLEVQGIKKIEIPGYRITKMGD